MSLANTTLPENADGRLNGLQIYTTTADSTSMFTNTADTHMFHIHINSFQLLARGQVNYHVPLWRDTLLVNCASNVTGPNCAFPGSLNQSAAPPPANPAGRYGEIVQFAQQTLSFNGAMVMHCHNVNHEDNGMMNRVDILP